MQIENVLTSHPGIHEAAVVAVPDPHFGEVVGAWIVQNPQWPWKLTKTEVQYIVSSNMNPQVCSNSIVISTLILSILRVLHFGFGLLVKMDYQPIFQKQQVENL